MCIRAQQSSVFICSLLRDSGIGMCIPIPDALQYCPYSIVQADYRWIGSPLDAHEKSIYQKNKRTTIRDHV